LVNSAFAPPNSPPRNPQAVRQPPEFKSHTSSPHARLTGLVPHQKDRWKDDTLAFCFFSYSHSRLPMVNHLAIRTFTAILRAHASQGCRARFSHQRTRRVMYHHTEDPTVDVFHLRPFPDDNSQRRFHAKRTIPLFRSLVPMLPDKGYHVACLHHT
jgi:hypothetical protein